MDIFRAASAGLGSRGCSLGAAFGIIGDFIIGILGAFIASWLLPQPGIHHSRRTMAARCDLAPRPATVDPLCVMQRAA